MREKKKSVGRPPLAKGEAKAIVLQSRVQPAANASYQRAAKSAGVDLSTWIRQTLNERDVSPTTRLPLKGRISLNLWLRQIVSQSFIWKLLMLTLSRSRAI